MTSKILLSILIFIIVPELLGLIITKFMKKEKNNLIFALILGYLIEFSICQIITVPMIFAEKSFSELFDIYIKINIGLSIFSILLNITRLKELIKEAFKSIKETPKVLIIIVILLVTFQVYVLAEYMHIDDDDAFYVGTAVTTLETDTIYKYSPTTGSLSGEHNDLRYKLGPFPIYYAIMSKIIDIHPAIFAHTIMPMIFIPLTYMVWGLLGKCLFKSDKEKTLIFIIFINIITLWGNYSTRNNFTFFLFRIWQGKAILANMFVPAVWVLYLICKEEGYRFINYITLFILILAGCLTTTMGIALPPLSLMLIAAADELSKINLKDLKSFKFWKACGNLIMCLICCVPAIVYGLAYFI